MSSALSSMKQDQEKKDKELQKLTQSLESHETELAHRELQVKRDLEHTFRPEFLNRVDEIIIFHPLSREHVRRIVDLQMREIEERLSGQGLSITLTEPARDWLAQKGYDVNLGARPLRRTLQREVESPLALRLLKGEFKSGDTVHVDVSGEQMVFVREPNLQPAEEVAEHAA